MPINAQTNQVNTSSLLICSELLLTSDISLRWAALSSKVETFLLLRLNSLASLSESAALRSHQQKNNYSSTSVVTQIAMKTSGMMPKKPSDELLMMAGRIEELSLMAEGENKVKTPMRQIRISRTKGMSLKRMEGTLKKYFWSSFGPQAQQQELSSTRMESTPSDEKTCVRQPVGLERNRQRVLSKQGWTPVQDFMLKQGVPLAKQKNWQMKKWAKSREASESSWKAQTTRYLATPLVGRLLMPPFQMEMALVMQMRRMVSQPVRRRARKGGDWTQVRREQEGLQMGSNWLLMQLQTFCMSEKEMSLRRKQLGWLVMMTVEERVLPVLSTRLRVVVPQQLRTRRMPMELARKSRKNTKMYSSITAIILTTSLIRFNRSEISTGMGFSNFYSSSYFSFYFNLTSSSSNFSFSEMCSTSSSLISSQLDFFSFSDFCDGISLLVPRRITDRSSTCSTSSTTTALYKSSRLMSCHEGRLVGVRIKQRMIRSYMAGEKADLLRMGLRVGSKAGISLVMTLWRTKPKDQMSIFSKLSLNRFQGKMMFSFISGAQQSKLVLSYLSFFSILSVTSRGYPNTIFSLCTQRFLT